MSEQTSLTPVSYWVRRRREQDALSDKDRGWIEFAESAAAVDGDLLEKRAS